MRVVSPTAQCLVALLWWFASSTLCAAQIKPANCIDFINETPPAVTCSFLVLPLDHERPKQGSITLPLLVARSTHRNTRNNRAILVPGAGGPGASMGFGYKYRRGVFLQPYQSLLRDGYDIVILDQRGAGMSTPRLTCFESIDAFKQLIARSRSVEQEILLYQRSAARCRRRLQTQGVEHFDTAQSARDFLDVMEALDYQWWGTIATSYATVIAQTMLKLKPDAFDKVVLDSPVPLDYQRPITDESAYQSVLQSLTGCRQKPRCKAKYPHLVASFKKIVRQTEAAPLQINLNTVDRDFNNQKITLTLDDSALLSILANAIYSNEGIAALPAVVADLASGSTGSLRPFAEDYWYQSTDEIYADGLSLTVHCKERQILETQYLRDNPQFLQGLSSDSRKLLEAQIELCRTWGVTGNKVKGSQQQIATPTLVVSGSLDPVISKADIINTIDDFSTIVGRVEITGAGHAVWYQSQCVQKAIVQFFNGQAFTGTLAHCELEVPEYR